MKLFIGNKAYSSWSLRGWLAARHSGLPFEEVTVPLYDEDWNRRREGDEFAPSGGKVPILWDGNDIVVWDSLAIIDYLNEKTGGARGYWPADMMFAPVVTRFITYSIPLPRFALPRGRG